MSVAMEQQTAFVTGATGFLGLHIVEQLLEKGVKVHVLHRRTSNLSRLKRFAPHEMELHEGSILDPESLIRAIPEGCDLVFHVAGNTSMWWGGNAQQTRDNVEGTRNMVEASLARKVKRFVQTSSVSAYGHQPVSPFDERAKSTALQSPIHYERTKYQGELEVEKGIAKGLSAVIMNPGHIIGKYDDTNWSRMIVLVHRRRLPGVPPGEGSFADAREVAKAHLTAAEQGKIGERYLLGGADASYLEMVRIIGELTHRRVPKRAMPVIAVRALGRLSQWASYLTRRAPTVTPEIAEAYSHPHFVRSDKAIRELGYRAVPLKESLRECHRWMVAEGLLR